MAVSIGVNRSEEGHTMRAALTMCRAFVVQLFFWGVPIDQSTPNGSRNWP